MPIRVVGCGGLTPVELSVWSLEIEAVGSCQESESGIATIEFLDSWDTEQFLDLAQPERGGIALRGYAPGR